MRQSLILFAVLIPLAACQPTPGTPTSSIPTLDFADEMATSRAEALSTLRVLQTATSLVPTGTPRPTTPVPPTPTVPPLVTLPPPLPLPADGVIPNGAVGRQGIGVIRDTALSSDGLLLAVGTTAGFYVYDTETLEQVWGHMVSTPVAGVAWSPDRQKIVAFYGSEASVRAASSGRELLHIEHSGAIGSVAWSPESTRLAVGWGATGYEDPVGAHMSVWDIETLGLIYTVEVPMSTPVHAYDNVHTLAWSAWSGVITGTAEVRVPRPDGGTDHFNAVLFWDDQDGSLRHISQIQVVGYLQFASLSPDGQLLATYTGDTSSDAPRGDERLLVWDVRTGELLHEFDHSDIGRVYSASWSPDSRHIAAGVGWFSEGGAIAIWDINAGERVFTLEGHNSSVINVAWSLDGSRLVSSSLPSYDGLPSQLRLWDAQSGSLLAERTDNADVVDFHWVLDSDEFVTATGVGLVILDAATAAVRLEISARGESSGRRPSPVGQGIPGEPSPDLTLVASRANDQITIYDANNGDILSQWDYQANLLRWSPNSQMLAAADYSYSSNDGVQLRNPLTGVLMRTLSPSAPTDDVTDFAWSPDSERLAVTFYREGLVVWEVSTGERVFQAGSGVEYSGGIAWSPDGNALAVGMDYPSEAPDYTVQSIIMIWDAQSGQLLRQLTGHPGAVFALAWAPDGSRLASAGGMLIGHGSPFVEGWDENAVIIWDTNTWAIMDAFRGHTGLVYSVSWLEDGSMLESRSNDGTVIYWDGSN